MLWIDFRLQETPSGSSMMGGGMGGGMGNGSMGGGMGGAEQWQSSTRWDQRTCEKMGYSGRAIDNVAE